MEHIALLILSISFTAVITVIGYFLRSMHIEVKQFIKELTDYTNKLNNLIVEIQTHIDKGIEADITEIKADIKELKTTTLENANLLNKNRLN